MLASFSTFPTDKGESVSRYVAGVIDLVDSSGLKYKVSAMNTIVEGDWDEVMELIKKCHHKLRENSRRVYTIITIDDREGAADRLTGKVAAIERKLGREVKK